MIPGLLGQGVIQLFFGERTASDQDVAQPGPGYPTVGDT